MPHLRTGGIFWLAEVQMPSVEIHVPISPTRRFFTQAQLLTHSIRKKAGSLSDAKIVLTVGDPQVIPDLQQQLPWMERHGVEVRWVDEQLFAERSYYATAVERFRHRFESDLVLLLDADTVFCSPIEDLLFLATARPALYGLVTHVSPLQADMTWTQVWQEAGLPPPALVHEHTGYGYMAVSPAHRLCPAYFNLGVLVTTSEMANRIGSVIYSMMDASDRALPTHFRCQIGVALAIASLGITGVAIPMRFNMANDVALEALHPDEARDARVIHYLRENQEIGRDLILNDRERMLAFLRRDDLRVTNAKLQALFAEFFEDVDAEQRLVAKRWRW